MPREQFIYKTFYTTSRRIIADANAIIDEYQGQGFVLTLRQLYYQFVARDLIENSQKSYKRLGQVINDARLAGLIDWYAIEDRTRNMAGGAGWTDPESDLQITAKHYHLDRWHGQAYRVEVWIEKEALVGVIQRVCDSLDLPYFACRGYVSQSEQYRAGKRLEGYKADGQQPVILHLGDHDPSGIDMTRDNDERLTMFARYRGIELKRIALNMDQVREHKPPPNPAKTTDSRYARYIARYGHDSWELDALDPNTMEQLIVDCTQPYIDSEKWDAVEKRERRDRAELTACADRWQDVRKYLSSPRPPEPDPTRASVVRAFRDAVK